MVCQGPYSVGRSRQGAPVRKIRLSPLPYVYHRPVEVVRVEVLGENTAGGSHLERYPHEVLAARYKVTYYTRAGE
jgi:hypothetical protein